MSHPDPYSPPQAPLGGPTPAEQHERDSGELRYATFWQRVGATLIDFLILLPFLPLDYFAGQSRMYHAYAFVPMELFSLFFYVYLTVRYGGTPGKLLLGLRVASLDGSRVLWKAAVLRYAPLGLIEVAISLMTIMATLAMTDEAYGALGYFERSDAIDEQQPMLMGLTWLFFIWMFACLVTMMVNDKRRTLHDFIAGTVVLRQ
jgi:uncharacterized RDD family membrane protein YckC